MTQKAMISSKNIGLNKIVAPGEVAEEGVEEIEMKKVISKERLNMKIDKSRMMKMNLRSIVMKVQKMSRKRNLK